jgi:hypothetical protein
MGHRSACYRYNGPATRFGAGLDGPLPQLGAPQALPPNEVDGPPIRLLPVQRANHPVGAGLMLRMGRDLMPRRAAHRRAPRVTAAQPGLS